MNRRSLSLALLAAALLASCGGGKPVGADDLAGDTGPGVDLAPPADSIDTSLASPEVRAGDQVRVECIGSGFDYRKTELVVLPAKGSEAEVPPDGDATPGSDAAPGADAAVTDDVPAGPPDTTLPEGVTRNGDYLTFTKVGGYTVACYAPERDLLDPTPAQIVVVPGQPRRLETVVDPLELRAGEWITITCSAWDGYDNEIEEGLLPAIAPMTGVTVSGNTARLTKVGDYTVACVVKGTSARDETPETVKVLANVPKKIHTTVDPTTFVAGGSANIGCSVTDAWDNPVPELPVSLYLPPKMEVKGTKITSIVAGIYPVKCVPQNEDWKYFELETIDVTVVPGNPSVLELKIVPDKPFYGVGETIQVTPTARDQYGNAVPGAVLGPAEIEPPVGIKPAPQNPTKLFVLNAEGKYLMTFRLQAWPEVYTTREIKVAGSGPLLTIFYPERGQTISGKPSVTVSGQVNDEVTGLKSFRINGKEVSIPSTVKPDGSFSYILNPIAQGLNTVWIEVENEAGFKTETGRGFYFSYVYYPVDPAKPVESLVKETVRAFLGQDFIDDGNHDPTHLDDVATLLEQFLGTLNIGALIPSPVASADPYKVYLKNVKYGKPTIQLDLMDDALGMKIRIPNLSMDVDLKGTCKFLFIDFCPDLGGDITVDKVTADAEIELTMDANKVIHAKTRNMVVKLDGIDVDVDGLLGDLFDWLIDLLVDTFADAIVDALQTQIVSTIDDTLNGLFAKFTIQQSFEIPPLLSPEPSTISLMTRPSALAVKEDGIGLSMDAMLWAPQVVSHEIAGSIARSNCLTLKPDPFEMPKRSEFELALFDDVLNQALHAVWMGGTINQPIPDSLLAGVDLGQYGVQDLHATLDFYLPPIVTDCPKELPKQTMNGDPILLQAQVGDLYVEADLILFGEPLHLGLFINAKANIQISMTEDPATGQDLISVMIPEPCKALGRAPGCPLKAVDLGIEIVSINEEFPLTKDDIMNIVQSQVLDQALAGLVDKELASFAIPALDLGTLLPDAGSSLPLDLAIDELYRQDGFTVVGGHLE